MCHTSNREVPAPVDQPPTPPAQLPAVLRALRHRNYQLFFGGQFISLIGTWMQNAAQLWLVYRLTDSARLLGLVGFAGQLPVLLLSPLGGSAADRYSRRSIVIATQISSMFLALLLAGLTLTARVQVWHVFALATLLGVVNAFDVPARQSFVVEMVGREDLVNAIALNSTIFNGARMIGPAVAGLLIEAAGEGWCFFANGISYVAVIVGLLMMTMTAKPRVLPPGSALASMVEGFRYVKRTGPVRALLLLLGLTSLVGIPYAVLMPIFAKEILHGGPRGYGILMSAIGVGALAGALTLAAKKSTRGLSRWVALSAAGFGLGLVLFSLSRSFWFSAALLLPVGFSVMVETASSNTLIQLLVPDSLRGRVMAVYSMMLMGMAPLGSLLAGMLAQHLGAAITVALGGIVCVVGAVVFGAHLPALRQEARQIIVALQAAGGEPAEEMTGGASAAAPLNPGNHQGRP